jgi:hypothetical protein
LRRKNEHARRIRRFSLHRIGKSPMGSKGPRNVLLIADCESAPGAHEFWEGSEPPHRPALPFTAPVELAIRPGFFLARFLGKL